MQLAFPAFAGGDTPFRIEIEENIVPAFRFEPIGERDRGEIVLARMAEKNTRHGRVAGKMKRPTLSGQGGKDNAALGAR